MNLKLYQFHISPYCGKVRAVLAYKGLEYEIVPVHPVHRYRLLMLTKQRKVPVLQHGTRFLTDSTRIVQYLEEQFPMPSVMPRGRRDRAQAMLWEDWADESLQRVVGPLKFLDRGNARRMAELENAHYPGGNIEKTYLRLQPLVARQMAFFGGTSNLVTLKTRLAELLQIFSDRLEGLYLVGKEASIADFSVFAVLEPFEGCNGWYMMEEHGNLMAWYSRIKETLASRGLRTK